MHLAKVVRMSSYSPAHMKHVEKVLKSIKSKMKPPNELNEYQASVIIKNLLPDEQDVFLGLTHWRAVSLPSSEDGFLIPTILDTKREYESIMRSSVLITNRRLFLLAQNHHVVITAEEFEGWDLGQYDTVRMACIEIQSSLSNTFVEFMIQKGSLSEFREAMLNLGKPEIDPPTNEAYFASFWKGPIDEATVGDESTQVSSDPARFSFSMNNQPRHRPSNSP